MSSEAYLQETKARPFLLPLWILFLVFGIAEGLTALLSTLAGLICHGIVLTVFLISASFLRQSGLRNLVLSLSLVPMVRIMSLSMPLASLPQIYWYVLIYAPLLIAGIVVMRITGLRPGEIGVSARGLWWQIPGGIFLGVAAGLLEFSILRPQPLVTEFSLWAIWLPALIMFMTTGLVEEFIFRGILQRTALSAMGISAIFYISAIFAILHVGHLSFLDVGVVFVIAVIFAAIVQRTGSLTGVVFAHGITNIFLYFVGPFLLP